MDSFAYIVILWSAFLGSSIVIGMREATLNMHNYAPPSNENSSYDVTEFGAVGDGKTDDVMAFQSVWKTACEKDSNIVKITVPSEKTFLLSAIEFEGPCKSPSIVLEILGNIVAPSSSTWKNKSVDKWLYFYRVDGLTVVGNGQGVIDGQGDTWWKPGYNGPRPNAMQFSHCNKLQVRGLKHKNSQKVHVSLTACNDAIISNLNINAPSESPNTDGIGISSSANLHIQDCVMATGDDCIAIKGGTSNVTISNIVCGPGHGISVGSLGKNGQHDEVEAISITNCTLNQTDNGVRIKTWQGGSGFAKNITFSKITFIASKNPIFIDQYYCPHRTCTNKTSAVEISNVRYSGLHGTSISESAVNFSCSQTLPCTNIILDDVDIESTDPNNSTSAHCINAHGEAHTLKPPVNCLLK